MSLTELWQSIFGATAQADAEALAQAMQPQQAMLTSAISNAAISSGTSSHYTVGRYSVPSTSGSVTIPGIVGGGGGTGTTYPYVTGMTQQSWPTWPTLHVDFTGLFADITVERVEVERSPDGAPVLVLHCVSRAAPSVKMQFRLPLEVARQLLGQVQLEAFL